MLLYSLSFLLIVNVLLFIQDLFVGKRVKANSYSHLKIEFKKEQAELKKKKKKVGIH